MRRAMRHISIVKIGSLVCRSSGALVGLSVFDVVFVFVVNGGGAFNFFLFAITHEPKIVSQRNL